MRSALLVDMQQPHLFAVRVALSLCILSACLIRPGRGIYLKIQTKQKQRGGGKKNNDSGYSNYKFASLYINKQGVMDTIFFLA